MSLVLKFKVYHPLVFKKLKHNLTKFSFSSCIFKPVKTDKKLEVKNIYGINNKMDITKSTAIDVPSIGDSIIGSCDIICISDDSDEDARPSESKVGKKESKIISDNVQKASILVKTDNIIYRHTRFARTLNCNRSLPDTSTLQNVCLLRDNTEATNVKRHFSTGDIHHKKEKEDVNVTVNLRKWITTSLSEDLVRQNKTNENGQVFKLMNYNVLAQDLLTEHAYLYKSHSAKALLWETRWKNLYDEITGHNADIICLQEVQESHIENYYSNLTKLGYAYLFKKRTGLRTDGCALFYRTDMFHLDDCIYVEYYQPNVTILDRENVAIVAVFSPVKEPNAKFVVATTHLLYNPRRQDVRVAQTQVLLTEVERMAFKGINEEGVLEYYPVIITGDFNSEPDSAVVELIERGRLKYDVLAKKTLMRFNMSDHQLKKTKSKETTGKELIPPNLRITDMCQHLDLLPYRWAGVPLTREQQEEYIHLMHSNRSKSMVKSVPKNTTLFSTGELTHNFNLKSSFPYRIGNDTTGTTYQDAWINVDYIFYSTDRKDKKDGRLKLLSRYSVPTTRQLNRVKTIPNFVLGSDHLALLSKFKLEYKK